MKKSIIILASCILMLGSCSKTIKEAPVQLQPGTPAYDLGVALSEKVPYLSPDSTKVLASIDNLEYTNHTLLSDVYKNFGNGTEQLKGFDEAKLMGFIDQYSEGQLANRMLVMESNDKKIKVEETEIDSLMKQQFANLGGEENFKSQVESAGLTMEYIREDIRKNLAINKYIDEELKEETEVTEEEIQAVQAEMGDEIAKVSARHILLNTQGKSDAEKQAAYDSISELLKRAKAGEDFEELAKNNSDCPSSARGGDLGPFGRGQMVKPFEEAAFSASVGDITDIVETQFGYHIIQVYDQQKSSKTAEQIETELKNSKMQAGFESLIEGLKAKYNFQKLLD